MNREEKIKEKRKPLVWICRNSGRYLWAVGLLAVVSAVISGILQKMGAGRKCRVLPPASV